MARSSLPSAPDIPLRLRRRRDGSMALTDPQGRVSGDGRVFPSPHVFTYRWLSENPDVARLSGDEVHVELVNARAVYRIVERSTEQPVLTAEVTSAELFDAPAVDEKKAAKIAGGDR